MEADSRYFKPRHPMGVVSRRTGLKPDVLRAWEKRYQAVRPSRRSANRRFYSDADIEKLLLLRRAIDGGRRIGQVVHLDNRELEELVAADQKAMVEVGTVKASFEKSDAESHFSACLVAVKQLNANELKNQLERAAVDLSQPHLIEGVLVPLMEKIGNLWSQGSLKVVHEHMASAVVRSFLGGMQACEEVLDSVPHLIAATPVRQFHELGALIVAATSESEGWGVTYLGAGLPAEEIAAAALQKRAGVVALSIVYPSDDPRLPEELRKLRRHLGHRVALLVGGRSALAYAAVVKEVRAKHLKTLSELRAELRSLRWT